MKKKSKWLTVRLCVMFCLIAFFEAQADIDDMIQEGIDYLEAHQDETSKLWGTDKETPHRDGAVVVDVLARLRANYAVNGDILEDGFYAVHFWPTSSTDYLARKIIASASYDEGIVNPYLIDSLVNMRNNGGSWGYQKGYASNTLETALAIKALVAASYEDPTPSVLTPAANFLVATQNYDPPGSDFGWGFFNDGDSKVLFTAHAVTALSALQDNYPGYDFSTQIANAFIFLQNVQNADEGFGSDWTNSNAYETGLAICAMSAHDPAAQEILDALGYLEGTQLTNGSWNDDAYSTAVAISGLNCIEPDILALFEYLPGDANMHVGGWPPVANGLDQTYLYNYLQGNPCCPPCLVVGPSGSLWASADVNASCNVNGLDVTYYIAYFKGKVDSLKYCLDFEPAWPTTEALPDSAPSGWPNCYEPSLTIEDMPGDDMVR